MSESTPPAEDDPIDRLFALGGDMGRLMRAVDWAETPVGPPESWPPALRGAIALVLGSASQLCMLWGPELIQFYNDAFRPILGVTKHPRAMGQRARDCWSEVWEVIQPMYARVLAGGATSIRDGLLVLERNGFPEECYFDYTYSPLRDDRSEIAGILAICSEVTHRVLSERRMRTLGRLSAASLAAHTRLLASEVITTALRDATFDVPFALVYLLGDGGREAVLASAVGVPPGDPSAPAIVPLDREAGSWPLHLALAREHEVELCALSFGASLPGGPWPEPARRALIFPLTRGGAERSHGFLVAGTSPRLPLDGAYREFLRLVAGTVAGVMEQTMARAAEETQRANLYRHFMQAPFPIAVFRGPRHIVDLANPETLRVWGKGPDVIGRPLEEGVPELRGQPFLGWLDGVFRTGVTYEGKEELARLPIGPDGAIEELYCNFVYAPLSDAHGVVEGILLSAFVVTEQVRARQAVERALERAELSERAKDEFLATMSHELRTPLNAMLGWAKVLKGDRTDEQKLGHGLAVIERNAEAQARLIGDLLDVSRIISGKLRLAIQRVDLAAVVHAAVDVVRQAAHAKGVRLAATVDDEVGAIAGDPDRLQQIVWNLLANAVKFTPSGGSVEVHAKRLESTIVIRVEDTGAGIAPEYLPLIFERFRQVDSSTTRMHGGLGLGLAIVRHLTEAHGGAVTAKSGGLKKGAAFTVVLPVRAVIVESGAPADATMLDEPRRAEGRATERRLLGIRILVVDDDADSLELLTVVLEAEGAVVTAAKSASAALERASETRFDLVLSDIGMPEEDGYHLIATLRARGVAAPAIALTAYARAEDAERARRAGFQRHSAKPVDAAALIGALAGLLLAARGESA